jgi:hypothetical protein
VTADPVDIITDGRRPALRVLICRDADLDQPWGDTLAPALLVDHRRGHTRLAGDVFQPAGGGRIEAAYERFNDPDRFERLLRQRYGTTAIAWVDTPGMTVVVFDTTDYRRHAGDVGQADVTAEQHQWRAWIDGDVYGIIVQHRVDGPPAPACGHDPPDSWVELGHRRGFYGLPAARQCAQHLLQDRIS